MPDLVAVYRRQSYSPFQHLDNDRAILACTAAELERRGWRVTSASEEDVEQGRLPAGTLYLNMCQGSLASEQLMPLEMDGALVVNRPTSVLNCHRHRLVRRLADTALPFPRTLMQASAAQPPAESALAELAGDGGKVWIKRGDVHAERREDVVAAPVRDVPRALQAFAARGIAWVALQRHIPGPVVKFYAVTDGCFFRWYGADAGYGERPPEIDEEQLRDVAFGAASLLGLEVFGGDVAFPEPSRPVLIDINDWPSFAPFRPAAARAIADYIHHRVQGKAAP